MIAVFQNSAFCNARWFSKPSDPRYRTLTMPFRRQLWAAKTMDPSCSWKATKWKATECEMRARSCQENLSDRLAAGLHTSDSVLGWPSKFRSNLYLRQCRSNGPNVYHRRGKGARAIYQDALVGPQPPSTSRSRTINSLSHKSNAPHECHRMSFSLAAAAHQSSGLGSHRTTIEAV